MTGQEAAIGQKLARALARVPSVPWEKVERQLFCRVPQPHSEAGREGVYMLSTAAQEAVIALGIYFIQSDFRHMDRLLDYLLGLQRGLATAVFPDEFSRERGARIPPAETFAFALTTMLNDVAVQRPEAAERVLEAQAELVAAVLAQLQELKRHEGPSPFNTRKSTCKCLVPVLLGVARAMARFGPPGQGGLTAKLFPRAEGHGLPAEEADKGFANFR
jgi:phosphatidylinositol 4-kinase